MQGSIFHRNLRYTVNASDSWPHSCGPALLLTTQLQSCICCQTMSLRKNIFESFFCRNTTPLCHKSRLMIRAHSSIMKLRQLPTEHRQRQSDSQMIRPCSVRKAVSTTATECILRRPNILLKSWSTVRIICVLYIRRYPFHVLRRHSPLRSEKSSSAYSFSWAIFLHVSNCFSQVSTRVITPKHCVDDLHLRIYFSCFFSSSTMSSGSIAETSTQKFCSPLLFCHTSCCMCVSTFCDANTFRECCMTML